MSISYEEALGTLTAMFGDPWTQESLDAVLRHYKGHMENTVEAILAHGDGDPQVLLEKLKSGGDNADTAMDAALARQLAQEERQSSARRSTSSRTTNTTTTRNSQPAPAPVPPTKKGRGTPTDLPPDFLRIPGMPIPPPSTNTGTMDEDEALARMLQDELFSQELRNNPEFAHLARGRPRTVGGRPVGMRSGHVGEMPRRASVASNPHNDGPNLLDKISELGDNAKNRLASFAAQWNEKNRNSSTGMSASAGAPQQETRGLLDDDNDGEEMEMTFAGTGGKKNM